MEENIYYPSLEEHDMAYAHFNGCEADEENDMAEYDLYLEAMAEEYMWYQNARRNGMA